MALLPPALPFTCSSLLRTGNSSLRKAQEQIFTGGTAQSLSGLGSWSPAQGPTSHQVPAGLWWHLGGPGTPAASEGCHLGSPEPPAPPRQMWPAGPVRSYPTAVPHLAALEAPLFGKGWHCHSSSPVLQGGTAELSTARRSHSELVTTGLGENTALPGLRQGREPAEMLALPLPLQNHRRWCL